MKPNMKSIRAFATLPLATLALSLIAQSSFAAKDPCWENERTRIACLKTYAVKDGRWSKDADPARAKISDADGGTGLHTMAAYNDVAEAQGLIAAGANVNAVSRIFGTPLGSAAQFTQIEMVDLLLAHGANPDIRDRLGFTPMMEALWQNVAEGEGIDLVAQNAILDSLIRYGANLNLPNIWGNYPLCHSIFKPGYRRKLIAAGADLNLRVPEFSDKRAGKGVRKPKFTQPALSCATHYTEGRADEEVTEALSDLLAAGARVDSRGPSANTPLMSAVANNHVQAVMLLLKAGAKANAKNNYGQNALMIAILRSVDPKIVEALIPITDLKEYDIYHRTVRHYLAGPPRAAELKSFGKLTDLGFNWTAGSWNRPISANSENAAAIKAIFEKLP